MLLLSKNTLLFVTTLLCRFYRYFYFYSFSAGHWIRRFFPRHSLYRKLLLLLLKIQFKRLFHVFIFTEYHRYLLQSFYWNFKFWTNVHCGRYYNIRRKLIVRYMHNTLLYILFILFVKNILRFTPKKFNASNPSCKGQPVFNIQSIINT